MGNPRGRENSGSPMSQSRTTPWDIIGQDPMTSLVLDTISVGVVVVNAEGKFLIWNQTATAILGMDADDVPPEEWSHHYHLMSPQDEEPMPADQLPLVRALRGEDAEVEILIWNPTRATKQGRSSARSRRSTTSPGRGVSSTSCARSHSRSRTISRLR